MLVRLFPLVLSSLSFFLLLIGPTLTKAPLEGRPCVANQTLGVYKPLEQCPSLLKKGFKSSSAPIVPGSDYSDSIICCINDTADNNTWSISAAPTSDSHAKAKAKCEEYSKLVDTLTIPPISTIDEETSLSTIEAMNRNEFTHMAAIGRDFGSGISWDCGGSVISERFVLVAARCTYNAFGLPTTFWIIMGDSNLDSAEDEAHEQQIRVIEMIRHPLYSRSTVYHDIALLKLEKNINFNEWVRAACLPYSLPDNATKTATAWGAVGNIGSRNVLLRVTMRLVPQSKCNAIYAHYLEKYRLPFGVIADRQLCVDGSGRDTCSADGPLVIVNSDHARMYSLIGIASYGPPCPTFTVYTRVYYYVPWIESIVWPN